MDKSLYRFYGHIVSRYDVVLSNGYAIVLSSLTFEDVLIIYLSKYEHEIFPIDEIISNILFYYLFIGFCGCVMEHDGGVYISILPKGAFLA